jgi:hypothetical protein
MELDRGQLIYVGNVGQRDQVLLTLVPDHQGIAGIENLVDKIKDKFLLAGEADNAHVNNHHQEGEWREPTGCKFVDRGSRREQHKKFEPNDWKHALVKKGELRGQSRHLSQP